MPGATEECLRAVIYRELKKVLYGKTETPDPEATFKPNLSMSARSYKPPPKITSRNTSVLQSTGSKIMGSMKRKLSDPTSGKNT